MFFLPVKKIRTLLELNRFFIMDRRNVFVRAGSTRKLEAVLIYQEELTMLETCGCRRYV
jgi:hypothetical protein